VPELPEVETIVRDLARVLPGRTVQGAEVLRPDLIEGTSVEDFRAGLAGRSLAGASRRAKNILLDLGEDILIINLGMTGRVLVVEGVPERSPHDGVHLRLVDGGTIVYHDVRRFGRLRLLPKRLWPAREAELGFEPLAETFTPAVLHELAHRSRVAVKTWLMDQRRVVGVGNIYASEALHRAGIDPTRPALSLTADEADLLHAAIQQVLREAIDFRGTTFLDYRDASGERGGFSRLLRVYDREGEPCTRCGNPVERIVQGGRSTFYCERCQR
jgi:formamidopyrimidine-DNA glycosylase